MPSISTFWEYNDEIKEEMFKLRGDVGYTHTTDTFLKQEGEPTTTLLEYFTCDFKVNVLRDRGDSNILIYDGDEVIANIPWSVLNSEEQSISTLLGEPLKLNYDVTHELYAKYQGNRKCLPSKSQKIELLVETPNVYVGILSVVGSNRQFEHGADITYAFNYDTDIAAYKEGKVITMYIDDDLRISGTTDANGDTGTLNAGTVSDGLHTVKAVFAGDEYNEATEISFEISVGSYCQLEISRTATSIRGMLPQVTVTVKDYFDEIVSNVPIIIQGTVTDGYSERVFNDYASDFTLTGTTNSTGKSTQFVNLDNIVSPDATWVEYTLIAYTQSGQVTSLPIKLNYYTNVSIEYFAPQKSILRKGETTLLVWQVNPFMELSKSIDGFILTPENEQIPILINESTGTLRVSNTEGNHTSNDYTLFISMEAHETTSIEFVDQYWSVNEVSSENYTIINNNFQKLSNGYKLTGIGSSMAAFGLGDGSSALNDDWQIEFDVVGASSGNVAFAVGEWDKVNSQNMVYEAYTTATRFNAC